MIGTIANLSELIAAKRSLHDQKDQLNSEMKLVNEQLDEVDAAILKAMEDAGLDKMSAAGMSVFRQRKERAVYQPESWGELVKWLGDHGYADAVQRRLNTKVVSEIIDSGAVLPAGLALEFYSEIGHRRG